MRVEDDVVIGREASQGPVVLTAEAVKEVDDVEAVCGGFWDGSADDIAASPAGFGLDEAVKRELQRDSGSAF